MNALAKRRLTVAASRRDNDADVDVMDAETEAAAEQAAEPQARPEELRLLEALLFASREPLDETCAGGPHARRHRCAYGAAATAD